MLCSMHQMELETKDYIHFNIGEYNFEGASLANKCLPGDIVTYGSSCKLIIRKKHTLAGVVEFASKTTYGITSRGHPMYLFVPFLKCYPPMVVGSSLKTSKNHIGLADFDSWTNALPRANLVRLLGQCGNLRAEEEALLLTYHPYTMPKMIELDPDTNDFIERMVCPEETFNIDPEGCMDIDDVLSVHGNQLWITIADVAERVQQGSPVDRYALEQGQTVYKYGQAIQPMLPYELSEMRCSLQPGEMRPGVSLILFFDTNERPYRITGIAWKLTCVKTKVSYSYENFKERADPAVIAVVKDIAEGILQESTDDPHKWVEAFMIYYNKEAAKILYQVKQGILRKHSGVDQEKWTQYTGWDVPEYLANTAAEYCDTYDQIAHSKFGLYCHSTSPIRRYSDLVNQRIIKGYINEHLRYVPESLPIKWLNKRQKDAKRYERDLFFLNILLTTEHIFLEAIVLEIVPGGTKQKVKLWINSWKRIVSWKTDSVMTPGVKIGLDCFVNPSLRSWKDRIVFRQLSLKE